MSAEFKEPHDNIDERFFIDSRVANVRISLLSINPCSRPARLAYSVHNPKTVGS